LAVAGRQQEAAVEMDENHNSDQADRKLLLCPEAEALLSRDVRQCWPIARFVRFLQPEAG
jgi:hypothetical protein